MNVPSQKPATKHMVTSLEPTPLSHRRRNKPSKYSVALKILRKKMQNPNRVIVLDKPSIPACIYSVKDAVKLNSTMSKSIVVKPL